MSIRFAQSTTLNGILFASSIPSISNPSLAIDNLLIDSNIAGIVSFNNLSGSQGGLSMIFKSAYGDPFLLVSDQSLDSDTQIELINPKNKSTFKTALLGIANKTHEGETFEPNKQAYFIINQNEFEYTGLWYARLVKFASSTTNLRKSKPIHFIVEN